MNRDTAQALLDESLKDYRRMAYQDLVVRIGAIETREIVAPDGTWYQVEIQVLWDAAPGGAVRVLGAIDDGGWRALHPLTQGFFVNRDA